MFRFAMGAGLVGAGSVLALSPTPRVRGDSDAQGDVLAIVLTVLPTVLISFCCFKLNTVYMATVSITTYILFRFLVRGFVLHKPYALDGLSTMMANVLLTFGLPSGLP